ncbi:Uncharacterised protein [Ectopseudomonas mendocina]|uniref:Uncharacterized protein n=1 Tax=Ectopseudomonas mendocina TaxID=300 RepID=A0A379PP30_ECTME|nr:hypothetical protein [Pseudomonas mendocina]SUE95829.1 Uncharacterised protein [Pseudomonas mendocina]
MNQRTPEELTEIAKKIHSGSIFSSMAVHPNDTHMLGMIFMPLLFAGDELREVWKKDPPHLVFAEMKDAMPRGINGYPCFGSCAFLNEAEFKVVREKLTKIEAAMAAI